MGLRISEGKINRIPEKRQIGKPIIVCPCGLCVFKHRESTLCDKKAQARTHATCIFTHESQMCKSAEAQRKLGSGQLKLEIKMENAIHRVLYLFRVPFPYLSYASSGQTW